MTEYEAENLMRGTLVRGVGSFYTAVDAAGELYTLRCKKKFRHLHLTPLAGDEVLFTPGEGEQHGWLEEILPRKTLCLRPPAANVTLLAVVLAPVPEPDLLLVDRLLARAVHQGMRALLVVNKSDLDTTLAQNVRQNYETAGFPVLATSVRMSQGLEELRDRMKGELVCMAGQSGVGKSSLLNALLGTEQEIGDLSEKIARGKNTTRHAELLMADGLRVLDTAGFSMLETEDGMPPEQLKSCWPEFIPCEGNCRFDSCLHDREPGCAVAKAVGEGNISRERWLRYRQLLAEVRESWRNRYD